MYNSGMYHGRITNPIAEARYTDGYSLQRLGKKLDLSRQYLSRAEQGTYSGLNKELVKYAAQALDISFREVLRRYYAFQTATRRNTASTIDPIFLSRGASANSDPRRPGNEIFAEWRAKYWTSSTAFSNAFCVHPELVRNYEDGIVAEIPEPIRAALQSVKLIDPNWTEGNCPRRIPNPETVRAAKEALSARLSR